tara:strand:+ start:878 stop:1075 length:198 start_codon:yes stop_codon:yes gene_type:complete
MKNKAFFVNVNMTIKVNNLSSIKFIQRSINDGMEFEENEGIIYFDSEVEEEQPNMNDLMAHLDDS